MSGGSRTVLITGAASGIGLALARLLAARGDRLFLVGRSTERLAAAAGDLGARLIGADLTDPGAVGRVAGLLETEAGALDLLVNGAGQLALGPAAGGADDPTLGAAGGADDPTLGAAGGADDPVLVADRLMQINFLGAIRLTRACLGLLHRGRRPAVVNLASLAGRVAPPYMAAYAASKAALCAYSHSLRQELRPQGIHVGLVLPGPVATPMIEGLLGGPYYPLPPGLPVLPPERVARAVLAVAERRLPELILPRRAVLAVRLGSAWPGLVDQLYRPLVRRGRGGGATCGA